MTFVWRIFAAGFLTGTFSEPAWVIKREEAEIRWILRVPGTQELSSVSYSFSAQNASPLSSQPLDNGHEIIAAAPGDHLWGPHPEKILRPLKTSLEAIFRDSMEALGWKASGRMWLKWDSMADWVPHFLESDFKNWTHNSETIQTLDEFEENLRKEVQKSRDRIFPGLRWIEEFDVVEPYASDVSHNETAFDAFTLFPFTIYRKSPRTFKEALKSFAEGLPRFPLEWMVAEKNNFSREERLGVLALLTHNHVCERSLVQAVAIQEGLEEAFEWQLLISKAYLTEQNFWSSIASEHEIDENEKVFPLGVEFLEKRSKWKINVSPKVRVYPALYGFKSVTHSQEKELIPYFQRYHYYGAFVVAARLRELGWSDFLLKKTVQTLGLSYKLKTKGFDRDQLKKMKLYYSLGADHFLRLQF